MYIPHEGFAVPFTRQLDGPVHPGRVIAIHGLVPHAADRFMVNLQTDDGPACSSDIALHISVRFHDRVVVLNSYEDGEWQGEEREGGLPLYPGQHFQMLIYCKYSKWKIAINGHHFASFHHRLSFGRVSHICVEGDVQVNNVSGVVGIHDAHQTRNPSVPHVQYIESIFPGRLIRVQGRVPHDSSRFQFNLVSGPSVDYDDIIFHASVRAAEGVVELNTKTGDSWHHGHPVRPCPVHPGQPFELLILVDRDNYKVSFNGVHFTEFSHRLPYHKVNHLVIDGHVTLHLVSFEGRPMDGGFGFDPLPPPAELPFFSNPYEDYDHQYHFFANPYPIHY